jgi:hypothetical protein
MSMQASSKPPTATGREVPMRKNERNQQRRENAIENIGETRGLERWGAVLPVAIWRSGLAARSGWR